MPGPASTEDVLQRVSYAMVRMTVEMGRMRPMHMPDVEVFLSEISDLYEVLATWFSLRRHMMLGGQSSPSISLLQIYIY